jgi:hypothetical protein
MKVNNGRASQEEDAGRKKKKGLAPPFPVRGIAR